MINSEIDLSISLMLIIDCMNGSKHSEIVVAWDRNMDKGESAWIGVSGGVTGLADANYFTYIL